MIHSRLVSFLNRHIWLQYVVGYLPVMIIGVYLLFYILDISSLVAVIESNDSLVTQHRNMGRLKCVEDYLVRNGSYELKIRGLNYKSVKAGVGDIVYSVKPVGETYCIYYSDNEFLEIPSVEMLDCEVGKAGVDIRVSSDGTYLVGDTIQDSVYNISVTGKSDSGFDFEVSDGYIISVDDLNVNFCNSLPTDDIYYDELTNSCIRNTNSQFALNFIVGSNLAVIAFSMLAYLVLLQMIYKQEELEIVSNRWVLNINLVFVCSLPLLGVFTFLIL